jgi:hypothetical protein
MNATICDAIVHRRHLLFFYEGLPRTVEPYVHGRSKEGADLLRAFQTEGSSKSNPTLAWRLFEVSKMRGLNASGDTFQGTRAAYNPDDPAMERIYCRL